MRISGDKIHVFKKEDFGDQLNHSIYDLSCKAYSIAAASKLFAYAIENLTLKGSGIHSISLADISSALNLLNIQANSLGSKIGDVGEAISEDKIMEDLNKYDASDLLRIYRGNTHKEDLIDKDVD